MPDQSADQSADRSADRNAEQAAGRSKGTDPSRRPFLYVVVCASGSAGDVGKLITAAQARRWDVGVIATPQGLRFIDPAAIEAQTGYPIRSAWRAPGDPRPLPPADAIAVAPATFNTINKWAAGISDTLALGILCEAYGSGIPTAVLPYLNAAQAAHPAYARSLDRLREMGVLVGSYRPEEGGGTEGFRWEEALDLLASARRLGL
ncbi:flavoprotein [Streptomyces sp. NPDC003023]|uniref:flavoprotein n=1 Tax=Streptomyces sp. NPDC003023 TaxID=3364675 RepID=UPI0036B7B7B0